MMNDTRVEELLLKLVQDMAVVMAKLDSLEEVKVDTKELEDRVDKLESKQSTHHQQIESLTKRINTMEEFTRNNMNDSNKSMKGIFVSAGLAVISAVISIVVNVIG